MTLEEYMMLPYKMEIVKDPDECGFVASFPSLKGCITYGETIESATKLAEDAKKAWLEVAIENGYDIPLPDVDIKNSKN